MKKIITLFAALFISLGVMAQEKSSTPAAGMKFTEGDFASVVALAKKENKKIFIDIYTTWCGPCKFLSANIFPDKAVGEYMNGVFVNAKFDAEKGEGIELAKKFKVKGYPTMIILDADGNVINTLVGSSKTPEDFTKRVKEAVDTPQK